jgi:hypothetical protein
LYAKHTHVAVCPRVRVLRCLFVVVHWCNNVVKAHSWPVTREQPSKAQPSTEGSDPDVGATRTTNANSRTFTPQFSLACLQVTRLVARSCISLTMRGVRGFPELRSLDLGGCDGVVPIELMPTLEQWTMLEELSLESCAMVTEIQLTLGRLRLLQVQGCRSLSWVGKPICSGQRLCGRDYD